MVHESTIMDVFDTLYNDSVRLALLVETGNASVADIVKMYYAASNLHTLVCAQHDLLPSNTGIISDSHLLDAKEFLYKRFDPLIHTMARNMISNLINDTTANLKQEMESNTSQTKNSCRTDFESMKKYERLKELLSTREFIEQYDAAIRRDENITDPDHNSSGDNP